MSKRGVGRSFLMSRRTPTSSGIWRGCSAAWAVDQDQASSTSKGAEVTDLINSQTERYTPDLVLGVWHRRKWLAIPIFVVVAAAAITVTFSLPNLYRASATVLVERQEVSEAFVRPSVTAELETRIQTIRQRAESRDRLQDVIIRL